MAWSSGWGAGRGDKGCRSRKPHHSFAKAPVKLGGVPLGLEWLRIISKLDRVGEKMWGPRA